MWDCIIHFIGYFLRNIFKAVFMLIAIVMLQDFDGNLNGDAAMCVILFFIFFATVSTTYDLGGGWFLKVTTGVGLGGAILGSFLVLVLSSFVMSLIAEFANIFRALLLLSFVLNQIFETIKFSTDLPTFFSITGWFCVVVYAIEAFCLFFELPSLVFAFEYDGLGGLLMFSTMALTVILTIVNIIARATQAYAVEY